MKLQMAREGSGFWGDGIELSWAAGREPDVIEVSDDQDTWPYRLRQRFINGGIIESDRDVTARTPEPSFPNKLMPGGSPEAIAHMAIPAPDVVQARAITTEETMGLPAPTPTGYAAMNVKELRVELGKRDLRQAGKKDELVARLEEHDAKLAEEAAAAAAEADTGGAGTGEGEGAGEDGGDAPEPSDEGGTDE